MAARRKDPVARALDSDDPQAALRGIARAGGRMHENMIKADEKARANVNTPRNRANVGAGFRAAKLGTSVEAHGKAIDEERAREKTERYQRQSRRTS